MKNASLKLPILPAVVLIFGALVVAGCSHEPGTDPISLRDSNFSINQAQVSPNPNSPSPTPSASPLSQIPNKQESSMKTITDFEPIEAKEVTLKTSKGDITFELYRELAPLTTLNFLNLVKSGFYDGMVFHRVIADFMAQVGDPLTKDPSKKALWGTGDPGYKIADEFGAGLSHDTEGIVSMANAGPNTGGSQFFITYAPTTWLDGKHAIFGKVTKGMDVLRQITIGDTITKAEYR